MSHRWKWTMYSSLHGKVSRLLKEENLKFKFHNFDDEESCIKSYDTNVMGTFTCDNQKCKKRGWASKKVAITIRLYENNRYNARVYSQHCKACNSCSRPQLDEESYAERVAYRLKKWKGIYVARPYYSKGARGEHEKGLCEGCKAGHCSEGYLST